MVEVTIYFHYGGEWLTSLEPHYDRGCVTYWKRYDPDLISFIDLVNEYINKLGFVGVQELIVLAPFGNYFETIDDEGVRTLTSFISTEYKSIHLFATEDYELSVDVTDVVMHDESFLLSPIVNEGTDYSESEDDSNNEMVFSCSDYDTNELENFVTKKRRNIIKSLQYYKEIVNGMALKDIAEAKQFCKLYALAKKVELVVVKSDKKRLRYTYAVDGYPFLLLISGDLTTPGDKLQSDPKYKVKEMKADLHRVFELNVSEAKCKRAKKEILESLEGSFVDSYNKLEGYATELRSCNPESDIVIDLSKEALSNGKRKFLRMYMCFKAMKLRFKSGLRPLIGYKPIIGILEDIRVKIMERLVAKEVVVRKWKDDGFSPKSELLFIEYLKISKVCKVSGNGDNGYKVTEALAVYKHKLQPVRGEPFWKYDSLHVIEPSELVKLVGRAKLMREREKDEVVKRQGVWKQTRKGKVMACSNCGEQNHNAKGCEKAKQGKQTTKKQGKQPAKQGKKSGRGKKRQLRSGLVDEDEASEDDINCTSP
ncbi:hypothetical protein RDI58_014905 [Solanum bulbocastanum]|uniref:Transposase, MuDR, MULE transposase domain protein n=1 Tax=Solanum bulbocastanum TaxID=147425 RepID=A0AAN8TEI2_SOLBU